MEVQRNPLAEAFRKRCCYRGLASGKVGIFNDGMHAGKKQKSFKSKALAVYLNSVEMIGGKANPFKGAVAISVDGGWSLVGAEGDSGYFFVLTGEDAGNLYSFSEIAGGGGTELGVSGEIARIDFSGDPSDFKADFLYGERNKVWLGGGIGGGASFGYAWSNIKINNQVHSLSAVSVSVGFSINPFAIAAGWNKGLIK